jgi:hypothetical protein
MVALQGGRPPFKGDSPHLRPQPLRVESSPTRSKILPPRRGGWVPHVMQAGPGEKKPNRHARGACDHPAVTSTPPLSPRPAGERADSHAGGMQPCQVGAPLRLQRAQHGGPGPRVMQPARRCYVRATAPPLAPLPRLLDCGVNTATRGNPAVPAKRDGQMRSKMGRQ